MTKVHLHGDVCDAFAMPAGALRGRGPWAGARAQVGARVRRSALDGRSASAPDATQ